jgi:DNA polymerase-1
MKDEKLILVDGHSLAYRAFHALPAELQTSKGELTNAVYGFATMLFGVLEEEKPEYVIVTFDKGPSFRVRDYEEYKAHREKMPDEMRNQMERVRALVKALGIPIVELEDYEADDLLGTLSRRGAERELDVIIVTGDRDAVQLVNDRVSVLTSGRRFSDTLVFTPQKVREKYKLEPEQIVDLKSLIGDKSDNIPGVYGVGEKGATKLLNKYGDLDGILEHVEELSTRYRKALTKGREDALISRHLARIVCDAPVELDLEAAGRWRRAERAPVIDLIQELEFRSLLKRLAKLPGYSMPTGERQLTLFGEEEALEEPDAAVDCRYLLVADEEALEVLAAQLREEGGPLAVDTETTGTDALTSELVGISLSNRENVGWYVPILAPPGEPTVPLDVVVRHLGPLLSDPSIPKVGHNLKYDVQVLEGAGVPLEGVDFDTMIAEWVINPDSPNLGLKNLSWARLGVQMTEISVLIGKGRNQKTMDQVGLRQVVPYACADADLSFRLRGELEPELRTLKLEGLFYELEMPLVPVLTEMEMRGVKVDTAWLQGLSEELESRLARLQARICDLAGEEFNVNSTQQLSQVLFEKLGLSTRGLRRLKSGYYSTRAEVLERLQGEHPIVDEILSYRGLAKLKSTYVDSLSAAINPQTGRVHTSYNQTATVTGRLSSSNPNLQNIPMRTEEGRRVRRAFVAEEGWRLVGADYSQVELRVMAHISGDEGLIGAFQRGEDIHATTAAAVFGVPLDQVDYNMRRIAKSVNFGLIFGQSPYGLAAEIGVPVPKAEEFIQRYFERFPDVREYMDQVQERAAKQGYVETLLGRRRYFPELARGTKVSYQRRQAAQRMAINAPIQGTAADIIKRAMLSLHGRLREEGLRGRMLLQVHDELVLEVPEDEVERTLPVVCDAMEGAFELVVPLKVDVEVGENWEEMEAVERG